ncbi:hypothetical protein [Protofrankia symbiont of Coriaria ruscifolia]|uniref:hypothetical protein n=1 Tax=Protofrankia symbiont of Coriaria ruscifolia TaxID=1306542 RepID=UPI001041ACDE|nr:hypothetical protein [Protofrankia symbiont of Coriaria ruscifolia]
MTPYSYTSKATVVLLSPSVKLANEPTASNPFLAFSGNLSATATVLMRILTDEDAVQKLVDSGATATYTVGPDPTAPGAPLLVMEAKDTDPAVAARTMDGLIELLKSELKDQQTKARAPADVLITATVVSDLKPERSSSAKKKAIAGGAAVTLVVPMLTAFAVEGAAFRRARRRSGDPDAGAQTPVGAESSVEVRESRYNEQPTVRTTVGRAFRSDPSDPSEPVAGAEFQPVRTSTTSGTTGRRQATGSAGHEADWDGFVELETSEFSRRMLPKR